MKSSLRILAIPNLYPTPAAPTCGTFVEQQVKGLRGVGLSVEVLLVDRLSGGMKTYWGLKARCRQAIEQSKPDIIHIMYGGVMADIATGVAHDCPIVVSFCGTDLLGEPLVPLHRRVISRYSIWASIARPGERTGLSSNLRIEASPSLRHRSIQGKHCPKRRGYQPFSAVRSDGSPAEARLAARQEDHTFCFSRGTSQKAAGTGFVKPLAA